MSIKNPELQLIFDRLRELLATLSQPLRAHKACFDLKALDETQMRELETVTARSFDGLVRAGFIAAAEDPKRHA